MALLSYSFCMSLLHSIWQAALLWALYAGADKILRQKFTPHQKKNLLFVSLAVQLLLFAFTFFVYYLKPAEGLEGIINTSALNDLFPAALINRYAPWFFAAYTTVIGYKLIKSVYEWILFKKQFKTGLIKPSIDLKLFTTTQQYHFGIKRKVQLWFSSTISTPLTFGFLKPVIVLPVALVNQLSVAQAETLILHELAHIKANDFLLNWFLIIAETVFFFNPFIVDLCKKIKIEREKNCDITVTAFDYSPLLYAETLLQAQTVKQLAPQLLAEGYRIAAVNKPQHLLNRIQFFINPANQLQHQRKKIMLPVFSFILVTVIATVVLFQLQTGIKKQATAAAEQLQTMPVQPDRALPLIVNNVLQQFTEENLNKISAAVEKQQPLIEKKLEQLQPLIKEITTRANKLAEGIEQNFVTPVAILENDAAKQIVVREEQSGSKNAVLKVYNVIFKDGKWILQPQWKLTAKEITAADSLRLIDTTNPPPASAEENTELQD
jgi:bla regulator protein blaR1